MSSGDPKLVVLGWHELVSLPQFGIHAVFAKLDTGSDHSVLHARDIVPLGNDQVEFSLPILLAQHTCHNFLGGGPRRIRSRVVDERIVRSSNGKDEIRYVIETQLGLTEQEFTARFSLTDRTGMRFPLLLGRSALLGRFLIDSGRAHLTTGGICSHPVDE